MIIPLRPDAPPAGEMDPRPDREGATVEQLHAIIDRLIVNQTHLGSQLNATMAALGTLTNAVSRQNGTIAALMDEVRALRAGGAGSAGRRIGH